MTSAEEQPDDLVVALSADGGPALARFDTTWTVGQVLAATAASGREVASRIEADLGVNDDLGRQRVSERVASALTNLKRRGFAEQPTRGVWGLTEAGRAWAAGTLPDPAPARRQARSVRRAGRLAELWGPDLPPDGGALRVDLAAAGTVAILRLFRSCVVELKRRDHIRNANVVGEWGERLVVEALEGRLAPQAEKGWDVECSGWGRVQVKARVVTDPGNNGDLQLGIIRSRDPLSDAFDHLAVVLFDAHLRVRMGVLLPSQVVSGLLGPWRDRVAGREVYATDATMFHADALDITPELQAVEARYFDVDDPAELDTDD